MSTKMDDMGEKNDWRLVAVALAGVTRGWLRDEEVRRGRADLDAVVEASVAERARRAEADAETELRRAEWAEDEAARLRSEINDLTVRLTVSEAGRAEAPVVPAVDPTGGQAGENARLRDQIDALYADLNALREKQLDTQARCDKAIQARIEAQRERVAAEKARDETAVLLGRASAGNAEYADQIKTLHADLEQAEAARDRAITAGNKYRADLLHNVSEIESLRGKNKQLSDDVERLRDTVDDARRARIEDRAGRERVQAANAKMAAELVAERAERAELEAERAKAGGQ